MQRVIVKNIVKTFSVLDEKFNALDDISFSLDSDDVAVIAGANGAGKSLLMLILAGLENPDSGTFLLQGKIGLIFQDADAQILGETPAEDIAFGPKNLKLSKMAIESRVEAALRQTGLSSKSNYPARFLSGGQKKRLTIAGILAMEPEIIIFDEPYANLDYQSIIQINKVIAELKNKSKTIIILTHEIEKCLAIANRFIILSKGKIIFDGAPQDGLNLDLEKFGIHNPLGAYENLDDLIWR
jgi:biotin transport system ATP-binding protein